MPVLQWRIGLLWVQIILWEGTSRVKNVAVAPAGESIRRRPWCRFACRDGHAARTHRRHGPVCAVHCPVDRHLPGPVGTRLILRKESPRPGAQLRFTDADAIRVTAFLTDAEAWCPPWSGRRIGVAAPPARPRRRPDPRTQGRGCRSAGVGSKHDRQVAQPVCREALRWPAR